MRTEAQAKIVHEAFARDWNGYSKTNAELQKAWGYKSWKSCREYGRLVRLTGIPMRKRGKPEEPTDGMREFIAMWNSEMLCSELERATGLCPRSLGRKAERARTMGIYMQRRGFAKEYRDRNITSAFVLDDKERNEIMGQFKRGVKVQVIADLHGTTEKNVMVIVAQNMVV